MITNVSTNVTTKVKFILNPKTSGKKSLNKQWDTINKNTGNKLCHDKEHNGRRTRETPKIIEADTKKHINRELIDHILDLGKNTWYNTINTQEDTNHEIQESI